MSADRFHDFTALSSSDEKLRVQAEKNPLKATQGASKNRSVCDITNVAFFCWTTLTHSFIPNSTVYSLTLWGGSGREREAGGRRGGKAGGEGALSSSGSMRFVKRNSRCCGRRGWKVHEE